MFALLILYLCSALFTDLITAALYATYDLPEVAALRFVREGLSILLFTVGFFSPRCPEGLRPVALIYLALVVIYAGFALGDDMPAGLVIGSAGKITLPLVLVFGAIGCVETVGQVRRLFAITIFLSFLSLAFGEWEISRTEFWTQTLEYGQYLLELKNVLTGYNEEYFLPFNFFGFEQVRRAAGLVAAPLAQGSVLATAAILGFAYWRERSALLSYGALAIFTYGVYQSGTRGALLMVILSAVTLLILSTRQLTGAARDLLLVGLLLAGGLEALLYIYSYTVNLEDGSTIGHVMALQENIAGLGEVALIGAGLGESGSLAADTGEEIAGGGEGAIFSIIYQIGLPGGLVFLWFYGLMSWRLLKQRHRPEMGSLGTAGFALLVGASSSMIISEHLLTVSGMAPMWLCVGACLAVLGPGKPNPA